MNRRDGGDGGRDLKRPRHGYDPNGRGRAPPRHYTRQGGFGGARGPPGYMYQSGPPGPPPAYGYAGGPRGPPQPGYGNAAPRRPPPPRRSGPRPSRECIAINRELTNPRTDVLQLFSQRGQEFNGVNLSTAIYQLAKRRMNGADPRCERLLDAAARRIEAQASEFDARSLANCAWGAVKIGAPSRPRLMSAVAEAAPRSAHSFNPQAIANTLYAFAKEDTPGASGLFEALSAAALPRIDRFNAQDLGNVECCVEIKIYGAFGHRREMT